MRRTTLGPISSSQLNARSSVVPTASSRASYDEYHIYKSSQARQSVGPSTANPSRRVSTTTSTSIPGNRAGRSSVSTKNIRSSVSSSSRLSSGAAGGRRSSTFSAGNRASSISTRNGVRQDPRPVTDKGFVNASIHRLLEFLSAKQYDAILSSKLLKGPTKKEACNILQFLFRQIDLNYAFEGKLEEEIALFFKILRYPFPMTKTSMVTVAPHSWPPLLASITWIIELLNYDETVEDANRIEEMEAENGDRAFLEYLNQAYRAFLSGEDEKYRMLEQELANQIDSKNQIIRDEYAQLTNGKDELLHSIEQAKTAKSSLPSLNVRKADYTSDLEKFKKLVAQLDNYKSSAIRKNHDGEVELNSKKNELAALQNAIQSLRVKIGNQKISADDVQRMVQERLRLQELVQQTEQRQRDLQSENWRLETDLVEEMDQLEAQVKRYGQLAMQLKLLPSMAKNAHGINYELELDMHVGKVDAAVYLSNHLRKHIRPALSNFRKNRIERLNVALDEASQLEQEAQKSGEVASVELQGVQGMEMKIRKVDDTLRREKETCEAISKQHTATTEDVELRIASILNEADLSAEELQSRQLLEEAQNRSSAMCESYDNLVERSRHGFTNALIASNSHKEDIERGIQTYTTEIKDFWQLK
ncbi:hypothetical protein ABG067_000005 [Albugo candida]